MDGSAERAIDWISDFVPSDTTNCTIIGHAEQDYPAGSVSKGTNFPPEVGRHSPLKLSGEALSESDEIGKQMAIHTTRSN